MTKNIILLKTRSDGEKEDPYFKMLTSHGYSVVIITPIDFEFCNLDKLSNYLLKPNDYSGIILSSPRCVQALSECVKLLNINLLPWASLKTFVVGETTEHEASKLGLASIGKECGYANGLATLISKGIYDKPLLYPKSNLANDTIETILTAAKVATEVIEVYRTIPHPNLETEVQNMVSHLPAKLIFFSPSGVNSVMPLILRYKLDLTSTKFYAIGETTEKAMLLNDIPVTATAAKPTPEALFSALASP